MAKKYKDKGTVAVQPVQQNRSKKNVTDLYSKLPHIKSPVDRYFSSSLAGINSNSWGNRGEYKLTPIFKYLTYESYFFRSVEKHLALLSKSGYAITSDNNEVKDYFDKRFMMMLLQTDISLDNLLDQIAFYLTVCSNAFVIKVRGECHNASEYKINGKTKKPVVGLFIAHPTTMIPKLEYDRQTKTMIIKKWIHKTGVSDLVQEFDADDVVHFTLFHQKGTIYGTPYIVPVIDDIRMLRKIEEDLGLLIDRDAFPLIHYQIENPAMIDNKNQLTEIDKAVMDLKSLPANGGIATDARHKISYVSSSGGKSVDLPESLSYFKGRVFTGLGVTPGDMGEGDPTQGASSQLIDSVKYIQQQLANQFSEKILLDLMLQSEYSYLLLEEISSIPKLSFNEIDIQWQIRKENHIADLFSKNILTFDEARNSMGRKTSDEETLNNTYFGLFKQKELDRKFELSQQKMSNNHNTDPSNIKMDSVKSTKSNSNITKSLRDSLDISEKSPVDFIKKFSFNEIEIYKARIESAKNGILEKTFLIKDIANEIVKYMMEVRDYSIEFFKLESNEDIEILDKGFTLPSNIEEVVKEKITEIIIDGYSNGDSTNRIMSRINTTLLTCQIYSYNFTYATCAKINNINSVVVYSLSEIPSNDTSEYIGKIINLEIEEDYASAIPPYRPNSKQFIKVLL